MRVLVAVRDDHRHLDEGRRALEVAHRARVAREELLPPRRHARCRIAAVGAPQRVQPLLRGADRERVLAALARRRLRLLRSARRRGRPDRLGRGALLLEHEVVGRVLGVLRGEEQRMEPDRDLAQLLLALAHLQRVAREQAHLVRHLDLRIALARADRVVPHDLGEHRERVGVDAVALVRAEHEVEQRDAERVDEHHGRRIVRPPPVGAGRAVDRHVCLEVREILLTRRVRDVLVLVERAEDHERRGREREVSDGEDRDRTQVFEPADLVRCARPLRWRLVHAIDLELLEDVAARRHLPRHRLPPLT